MRRLICAVLVILSAGCGEPRTTDAAALAAIGNDSIGPTRFDSAGRAWLRLRSVRWARARGAARADADERFIIREAKTELCCQESEHESVTAFDVAVWRDSSDGTAPLWTRRLAVDEADVRDGWYRGITRGCCDSSDLFEFHRLADGSLAFQASSDWITGDSILPGIAAPNSDLERSAAFHDRYTTKEPPEAAREPNLIGVLQYGSRRGPVQRYLVVATDSSRRNSRLQRLSFVVEDTASSLPDRALWSADGREDAAALTGFSIRVQLIAPEDAEPEYGFDIPVTSDRLDLPRVRLPRGVRIKRAP